VHSLCNGILDALTLWQAEARMAPTSSAGRCGPQIAAQRHAFRAGTLLAARRRHHDILVIGQRWGGSREEGRPAASRFSGPVEPPASPGKYMSDGLCIRTDPLQATAERRASPLQPDPSSHSPLPRPPLLIERSQSAH